MTIPLQPELFCAPSFPKACKFCPDIPRSPRIPAATPEGNRTGGSGGAGGSAACGETGFRGGQAGARRQKRRTHRGVPAAHLHFRDRDCPHLSASLARAPAGPWCSPPGATENATHPKANWERRGRVPCPPSVSAPATRFAAGRTNSGRNSFPG